MAADHMRFQVPSTEDDSHLSERLLVDARLDRIDGWPWSWGVLAILGAGFFWTYFDIGDLAASLPRAAEVYGVGLGSVALAASLGLYGYVVGEVLASFFSDLYGRRRAFLGSMFVLAVASLVNGLSPSLSAFDVSRFVTGAAIGASIGVITTYLSELSPAKVRGRYAAWGVFPGLVGLGAAPAIALGLVVRFDIGWRLLLIFPVLAVVPGLAALRWLPESPRWLAERDRLDAADAAVRDAETTAVRRFGGPLPRPVPMPIKPRQPHAFRALLRPPQLKWTVLMFAVWFANYLPVLSATLGVAVLSAMGFTLQTSITLSMAGAVGGVLAGLVAPHITDRWPRKYPAIVVCVLAAVCYVLVGLVQNDATIALAYGFGNVQVGIFAPLIYTATAEHFPTEARNVGMGLADGIGHLGGALGPTASAAVVAAFSATGYFVFVGSFFGLTAALVSLMKNTTGRTLEDLRATTPTGTVDDR